jgi:hypothetical protein
MPWHIEADNAGCSGYAVVKDENGEIEGCHRTRAQAERQLAALNIAEYGESRSPYSPTQAMKDEADRGLAWREEFGRGGTAVGVARARDISNGRQLPLETVARMVSYFARHEIDKQGEGWSPGEDGYPSAGRIAWALWGGDPGRSWAEDIMAAEDDEEDRALERIEGGEPLIVTDIDGTVLAAGSRPIRSVIDEINAAGIEVYVLTGRDESRRVETEQALDAAGLNYDELYMVGSQQAKKPQIDEWLAEYDIVAAYENDEEIRDYYRERGVPLGRISRVAEVEQILAQLRAKRYA